MKVTIKTILITFSLFCFNRVQAQEMNMCSTVEANQRMQNLHFKEVKNAAEQLENETILFNQQNRSSSAVTYTIPVVFHILHTYGTENISDEQVEDAVNILNRDFNKQNADTANIVSSFQGIAANVGITFKLAKLDPNGNCTNGIDRIYSTLTNIGDDDSKLNPWPRNKYLNIWVVKNISSGAAGYSMYPSSVAGSWGAAVDGIMILNSYVGSIGTGSSGRSRALTHEVGHWLNLKHTWGDSNSPGVQSNCNMDDNVSDTPNTIGWTSCNLNGTSCGSLDNVQNYMEYSYCSNMFTEGQKSRVLAALTSNTASRNNLWKSANLIETGVDNTTICIPKADFYAESPQRCVNSSISFFDNSSLAQATTWQWSFPGGTPSSSNLQNPVVQYNTPGVYSVSLTVGNQSGTDSVTKNGIVNILSTTPNITVPDFYEGFETLTLNAPGSNWVVNNIDGGPAWAITSNASYTGTKSIKLANISSSVGSVDEFVTPSMDLSQFSNPKLYYRIAYASLPGTPGVDYVANSFQILSSADCGKTWVIRKNYTENNLATVNPQNSAFTPNNPSQWRQDNVSLSLIAGFTNIQFKFKFTAGEGNNIYIDDININQPTAISELEEMKNNFRIYPNPSDGDVSVYFSTIDNFSKVNVKIYDIVGKEVYHSEIDKLKEGNHQINLNRNQLNTSGMYMVQIMINDNVFTKKLILN